MSYTKFEPRIKYDENYLSEYAKPKTNSEIIIDINKHNGRIFERIGSNLAMSHFQSENADLPKMFAIDEMYFGIQDIIKTYKTKAELINYFKTNEEIYIKDETKLKLGPQEVFAEIDKLLDSLTVTKKYMHFYGKTGTKESMSKDAVGNKSIKLGAKYFLAIGLKEIVGYEEFVCFLVNISGVRPSEEQKWMYLIIPICLSSHEIGYLNSYSPELTVELLSYSTDDIYKKTDYIVAIEEK